MVTRMLCIYSNTFHLVGNIIVLEKKYIYVYSNMV